MSRVQLRNKWWHRTTYSATNKTFALASAEQDSYQSCHSPRNASDWSPTKSGYYIWVCTWNTPISPVFQKQNIHHASHSGETLIDFLQKRALPPNTAGFTVTPGPGFSKKTSGSNANFTFQYPPFRRCSCAMEPSALLVTPVPLVPPNSGAAVAEQGQCCQQEKAKATLICSPASSLGAPFISSDSKIFSFRYLFQGSQAAPKRNLLEGPFLQGHSWRKWEISHTEIHHFATRVCTFWSPLGCEGKNGSREAQPCQDGSAWEHPKKIFGHLGKLDIENIGTHTGLGNFEG